jgi:hypothetical protein
VALPVALLLKQCPRSAATLSANSQPGRSTRRSMSSPPCPRRSGACRRQCCPATFARAELADHGLHRSHMAVRQTANNLEAGFCCAFTRDLAAIKQRRNQAIDAAIDGPPPLARGDQTAAAGHGMADGGGPSPPSQGRHQAHDIRQFHAAVLTVCSCGFQHVRRSRSRRCVLTVLIVIRFRLQKCVRH